MRSVGGRKRVISESEWRGTRGIEGKLWVRGSERKFMAVGKVWGSGGKRGEIGRAEVVEFKVNEGRKSGESEKELSAGK